jgi:hypothetical protein
MDQLIYPALDHPYRRRVRDIIIASHPDNIIFRAKM